MDYLVDAYAWLFDPEPSDRPQHLWARWLFLRALGLIYFSAFYSLIFQIKGLMGPDGILPAGEYLQAVGRYFLGGMGRFWYAPTMLWFGNGDRALEILCWTGIVASILVVFNIWPRVTLLVCFVAFLSFVAAAQDFSGYQSDGMLLEAGFICLFFAPPGLRPGLGQGYAPSRASLYLLRWEWFRIYFESGIAKMISGDLSWRNFRAMDDYYQNGPLPTWIGWYVEQWPRWFHTGTSFLTLAVELVLVWMLFLPRRFRIICFFIVTPFEIGIILTANYTFLNYLVLVLGILLLDDKFLTTAFLAGFRKFIRDGETSPAAIAAPVSSSSAPAWSGNLRHLVAMTHKAIASAMLLWVFYATTAILIGMVAPSLPLPAKPITLLDPFRIANRYGLFAVMTHNRYEIEFQGTRDGKNWIAYPFRYKPQSLSSRPGIYAPYQPRFEWNLWFASLGPWRQYSWVVVTEQRILTAGPDVLGLFASDPFAGSPPEEVRAVLWEYWFTDSKTRKATGAWWRREMRGLYCPALIREPDGKIGADDSPSVEPAP
jgi:lipase maturation factor